MNTFTTTHFGSASFVQALVRFRGKANAVFPMGVCRGAAPSLYKTGIGGYPVEIFRAAQKDYNSLPMIMDEADIAQAIEEISTEVRQSPAPPVLEVAEALVLMVARPSSHLRSFAPDVASKIEGWAVSAWSPTSAPLADALSTLMVNTDSGPGRSLLEQSRYSTDPEIRHIAEQALAEMQV